MPELKNCRRCNKVFSYVGGLNICPACSKEDEKIFEAVSGYLRENPGMPLSTVAQELDIGYDILMKYVKEGRLLVRSPNGSIVHFCEKCGTMIDEGRFCSRCENHIANVLDSSKRNLQGKLTERAAADNSGGYRFLAADAKKSKRA